MKTFRERSKSLIPDVFCTLTHMVHQKGIVVKTEQQYYEEKQKQFYSKWMSE